MVKILSRANSLLAGYGLNVVQLTKFPLGFVRYLRHLFVYWQSRRSPRFPLRLQNLIPILDEFSQQAGGAGGHYFHQDIWAARRIKDINPDRHVDIGSRIDGFISHLLVFRSVEVIDIRPLDSHVEGLTFIQADATDLAQFADDSLESISTLHAAEHFGLGRYGDPVDAEAYVKFMLALQRVLKPGGRLYFAVPCGKERLCFNAHRIFDPNTIINIFDRLKLGSLDAVLDDGKFYMGVELDLLAKQRHGCGLFEFHKDAL